MANKTQNAKIYLAEALIDLMKHEDFEEITVKKLAKRAGVSRMTYYRYFSDKKELLSFYMQYIFELFMSTIEDKKEYLFRSYEHILQSLTFFKQYEDFAKCLCQAGINDIMLDALNSYIRNLPAFEKHAGSRSYPLYFYAGALYNVYIQWILEDPDLPAQDLALIVSRWNL